MSSALLSRARVFRKHLALPQQHGSWALWLGPFAVGIGVGGKLQPGLMWLTVASLGGFLALQPLTILVKALAGRRNRADVTPATFWVGGYCALILIGSIGLLLTGNSSVLWLGLIAIPVLAWQLWLVAQRNERGQMGVEIVGSGALALAAPAAYFVAVGGFAATGWWLWVLTWLQAAGSIVYIYLRLQHRKLAALPTWRERWRLARTTLLYNSVNVVVAGALAFFDIAPWLILIPFLGMWFETVYGGVLRPAVRIKPTVLGLRQMLATFLFSALLILAYRL